MNKEIDILKRNVLEQAKYYLENADEFYPFGAIIDINKNVKPIGFFLDNENPTTREILEGLQNAILEGLQKKDYLLAAIGVDIYINEKNEQIPALEISIYDGYNISRSYFSYWKKEASYFFQEVSLK